MIYDAAHTFGAEFKGMSAAAYGDASIYSFHATKVFNTIEGGAVAFGEPWMGHRLNCLKNFGIVDQVHVVWVGGYAKIATVIGCDVSLLAQARPGDTVRFVPITVQEAEKIARQQEKWLGNLLFW